MTDPVRRVIDRLVPWAIHGELVAVGFVWGALSANVNALRSARPIPYFVHNWAVAYRSSGRGQCSPTYSAAGILR